MNFKRIARMLICMVLVCALVVNISPIRAEAVIPESIAIGSGIVIGSILLGLGVGMAQDSTQNVLTNLVNDCVDVIQSDYDFIDEDALIQVYADYSAETVRYYASQELVEAVQTWVFESETIKYTAGETAPDGYTFYGEHCLVTAPEPTASQPYSCLVFKRSSGAYEYIRASLPMACYTYSYGGTELRTRGNSSDSTTFYLDSAADYSWSSGYSVNNKTATLHSLSGSGFEIVWSNYDIVNYMNYNEVVFEGAEATSSLGTTFEVVEGVTLGHVASPDDDLSIGYPVWSGGAISIPGQSDSGDIVIGYPIGLAPTLEGTLGMTQTDVWSGVSTYVPSGGDLTNPDDDNNQSELNMLAAILGFLLGDLTDRLFGDEILSLPEFMRELFSRYFENLKDALDYLADLIKELSEKIENMFSSFGESISEAVDDFLTPDEDYLTDKVNALRKEFSFVNSIIETANELNLELSGVTTTPPIIYIDLGSTRGSYNMGGTVPFLDLSWYAEYKPTVDAIISAYLWFCLIWRMLIHLPSIISGVGGIFTLTSIGPTQTAPIGAFKEKPIYVPTESYEELLHDFRMDAVDTPSMYRIFGKKPSYSTLKDLYTVYESDIEPEDLPPRSRR